MAILEGHCFEPDRVLPYGPFLDLLRALPRGRDADDPPDTLGPRAEDLAKLRPELTGLAPGLPHTPALGPALEKRRLVDALSGAVIRLTATHPLLVIVEDLHWSDDASLELLRHLARRVATAPALLLLTYRDDEVDASLAHFLADLDRERLVTELPVTRLTAADLEAMVRSIFALPRAAPADLLHALFTLTEGNPFFVEEILKSLLSSGDIAYTDGAWERRPAREWRIPRSVQDVVQRRSATLPPATRRILTLAAVLGQRFELPLLQELAGLTEDAMLTHIKVLAATQLLVEESADRFAFRHALTREAIYAQLLGRERRALHRAVAAAIARLDAPDPARYVEMLAYHAHEAGNWAEALVYAQRAGERAQTSYAPRAAVEQFTRALEAAAQMAAAPSPRLLRARAGWPTRRWASSRARGPTTSPRCAKPARPPIERGSGDRSWTWAPSGPSATTS
jgi:predicted ATPase